MKKNYVCLLGILAMLFSFSVISCKNAASSSNEDGVPFSPVKLDGRKIDTTTGNIRLIGITGGGVSLTDKYRPMVNSFYMCETEVTQGQWQAVVNNEGYGGEKGKDKLDAKYGKGDSCPMYCVSWYDAIVFCNKLSLAENKTPCYKIDGDKDPESWIKKHGSNGKPPFADDDTLIRKWDTVTCDWSADGYRLPTEAEWMFAATANEHYKYSGSDDINHVAWHQGNSSKKTQGVKTKKANSFGLYDMSGNVKEWCWDNVSLNPGTYDTSQTIDPKGFPKEYSRIANRALCGGSYDDPVHNCAIRNRNFQASHCPPHDGFFFTGFRVVCRAQ